MGRLTENSIVNYKNKTFAETRKLSFPTPGAEGVLVAVGGSIAKGGTVTQYIDSKKAGEGRVDQTPPFVFSADETLDRQRIRYARNRGLSESQEIQR